jgi:hypothetical protein
MNGVGVEFRASSGETGKKRRIFSDSSDEAMNRGDERFQRMDQRVCKESGGIDEQRLA